MVCRFQRGVVVALAVASLASWAACGSSGGGTTADVPDAAADVLPDVPADVPADVVPDTPPADPGDGEDVTGTDTASDVPQVDRTYNFRAICGVSMGAAAMTIAGHAIAQGKSDFDVIGAMGGYIDYRYMGHVVRDKFMGGFCPMQDILDRVDTINDPTTPGLWCGPVPADQPYEWAWGFNQLHYNDNGGHWKREFYLDVIGSFAYAFGNLLYYNPENPLLPPGVPYTWMRDTPRDQKCKTPYVVPKGSKEAYNAEYNPKAEYDLVTVCDGDTAVGCKDGDPTKCGEDNPDYRQLASWYDPSKPHTVPYPYLLAVDYNGNGTRDYGEPIVVNAAERFQDVGLDGCADAYEDGNGGCLATPAASPAGDPNGDDYDLEKNPLGTEGNHEFDEDAAAKKAEPYQDFGLDGVADTKDYGEGDGTYTMSPGLKELVDQDIRSFFRTAPQEKLRNHTWYWDGGIRDAIHAITSNQHATAVLRDRGEEVKYFDDFSRTPTAVAPGTPIGDMGADLSMVDFSPAKFGRNTLIRYGNPQATPSEVLNGDGGHVGSGPEVVLRVVMFFAMAMNRLPEPIVTSDYFAGSPIWTSYYSEALQGRRWYVVGLPPGYDDEANKDRRYPVGLLLPGIGMPLDSMAATGSILALLEQSGILPHFIMVLPDGQCSYVRKADGKRLTGCVRGPMGGYDCVDDACKGPHETCTVTHFDNDDGMEQECNSGHFFVNHKTNIWGAPDAAPTMKYEDSLFEVVQEIDKNFRTRPAGTYKVPADW